VTAIVPAGQFVGGGITTSALAASGVAAKAIDATRNGMRASMESPPRPGRMALDAGPVNVLSPR
jgi:hypothetical protein